MSERSEDSLSRRTDLQGPRHDHSRAAVTSTHPGRKQAANWPMSLTSSSLRAAYIDISSPQEACYVPS